MRKYEIAVVLNALIEDEERASIIEKIKDGKKAYVKIVPCEKKDLNEYEKIFIELYGADRSFNATKGGAPKR